MGNWTGPHTPGVRRPPLQLIWKLAISSATLRAVNRPGKTLLVITLALLMPIVPFAIIGELPGERWLSASDESATLFALTGGGLLLADVLLPVPSSIVISLLGGRLGFVAGWATAWIGLTLGNLLGYWVGRLWPARMAPDVAEQPTLLILILSRPVPILAEAAAIGAGATRANFAHVAGACAAGNAVYTGILTATGASLVTTEVGGLGLIAPLLVPAIGWWLWRRSASRRSAAASRQADG